MSAQGKDLQLIELHIESVKRIRSLTIRPNGSMVRIVGQNGVGKSSALDAWEYLLGGASTHPEEVIRRGEKQASVRGTVAPRDALDEYFVIERKWAKESGTTLTVKTKEGAKVAGGAQAWVDARINRLSFDPLAFLRTDRKKQVEMVRQLVGVDTTLIEAAHAALFDKRSAVTAKGKELRARYDAMPAPAADVPDEPVSVDQLLNEQGQLQQRKADNDKVRGRVNELDRELGMINDQLAARKKAVEDATAALVKAQTDVNTTVGWQARNAKDLEAARADAAQLVDPDVAEVVRKISRASATNDAVRAKKERVALFAQLEAKRAEQTALNEQLEKLDEDKAKLLAAAKFPVPGLAFTAEGLTLNDLPLEQASSAEQLRVGVAMGFAMNPMLKFVTIKDGSLLDERSMQMVAELAEAAGGLVLVERVGTSDTGPCTIVIEDGHEQAEKSAA